MIATIMYLVCNDTMMIFEVCVIQGAFDMQTKVWYLIMRVLKRTLVVRVPQIPWRATICISTNDSSPDKCSPFCLSLFYVRERPRRAWSWRRVVSSYHDRSQVFCFTPNLQWTRKPTHHYLAARKDLHSRKRRLGDRHCRWWQPRWHSRCCSRITKRLWTRPYRMYYPCLFLYPLLYIKTSSLVWYIAIETSCRQTWSR